MRTNDPTEPERFQPLGEKVVPKAETKPEWKPLPHNSDIQTGPDGRLRTNQPLPKGTP